MCLNISTDRSGCDPTYVAGRHWRSGFPNSDLPERRVSTVRRGHERRRMNFPFADENLFAYIMPRPRIIFIRSLCLPPRSSMQRFCLATGGSRLDYTIEIARAACKPRCRCPTTRLSYHTTHNVAVAGKFSKMPSGSVVSPFPRRSLQH